MGILNDVVSTFIDAFAEIARIINTVRVYDPIEDAEGGRGGQVSENLGQRLQDIQPIDEFGGFLVDTVEEAILSELEAEGQVTPENVERVQDAVEGVSATFLGGVITFSAAIEAGALGQIDEFPSEIVQAVSALGFDDVTGREIDARLQEGVDPALKQLVHRDHRSKQADFQDFVQGNLAFRSFEQDIQTRGGVDTADLPDIYNPEDFGWLPDPDTYGTVPAQNSLFELAALNVSEPEELIEEPVQYGIPVPKLAIDQVVELRGIPEDAADIYREVVEQLPKTENLIQDYVRLTEFTFRLREKIEQDAIAADTAVQIIEPELRDIIEDALPPERLREQDRTADEVVDILIGELERNFALLESLPADPPTQGDIESWFRRGVITSEQYQSLYSQFAGQEQFFGQYLTEQAIRAGPDDIQEQFILGRISDTEARFRLSLIGFDAAQADEIIRGADPDDILSQAFTGAEEGPSTSLGLIQEVGDVRSQRLRQFGFETVEDVAQASVEAIAEAAGVGDPTAETIIASAQALSEAAAGDEG